MKMTVVTTTGGELVGAMYGHVPEPDPEIFTEAVEPSARAGLMAGPDQELHLIEVPDEIDRIESVAEFHEQLLAHVKEVGKRS